ncbi:hypothetical protein OAV58_01010 [Gammaproteobacteria bacterium]|jgi:hypothetical protein|nr:hypothetical protein [Gammaproteobacteria bacterium]
MRNMINNLNKREKYLIFSALLLVVLCIFFISIKSFLSSYNQATFNLNKAKSDYNYVKDRVGLAVKKKNAKLDDPDQIKKYLISNITTSGITLDVTQSGEVIVISFYSPDTKTGVEVISKISQLLERQILDLSISQSSESIYFKASL